MSENLQYQYPPEVISLAWDHFQKNQGLIIKLLSEKHNAAINIMVERGVVNANDRYHDASIDAAPTILSSICAWLRNDKGHKIGTYIGVALKSWSSRVLSSLNAHKDAPAELKRTGLGVSMGDMAIEQPARIELTYETEILHKGLDDDRLASAQRYVLRKYGLEMIPKGEIAKRMGISETRVKRLFDTGLMVLGEILREEE